jgi:hypothetical protein
MTEYLNKTFGIENNVSIPILVSLIVFIIGGISIFLIRVLINYFKRLQIRNSFLNILEEIIKKCKIRAKHTELFYPTLNIEHKSDWPLKFIRITYLELAF